MVMDYNVFQSQTAYMLQICWCLW